MSRFHRRREPVATTLEYYRHLRRLYPSQRWPPHIRHHASLVDAATLSPRSSSISYGLDLTTGVLHRLLPTSSLPCDQANSFGRP
ncbi:hypothetical protein HPP92_012763 [Vanilla planifolia]|uniref:Uncharacterized protein n=1 Tax=Vanilla planifolia TaxID=51239 RepID=A0A835UW47_VANPL|nr:hypothetical protein HPP92_012763 [Vanilla planifolia]